MRPTRKSTAKEGFDDISECSSIEDFLIVTFTGRDMKLVCPNGYGSYLLSHKDMAVISEQDALNHQCDQNRTFWCRRCQHRL
ncbi:hypothetical protein [Chengkuizengella axinellae]|uniref:Uncharacterized protein n=1 Tax=Chengkuizengella axinellae TaxID=3064388 RepID=A0ABT9J0G3_9BACL|nr:hypothetical protein [Chengkuizengella sp. 2205SS18-9]MDP5274892.1 hypothetical protein [Chengkuizengella sp. 2205SS18-9]